MEITRNNNNTKTALLKFYRTELLNDLDQYGFVEGDVQRADAAHLEHGKHQTQDITQDGNIDMVTRWLDLELSRCREWLYPFTKTPSVTGAELDDTLGETGTYTIAMTVPEDFSDSTLQYLEQLIHHLLVWWVLWCWFSITKPEGAEKWLAQAKQVEDEIKGALARGCGKVYRRMSPFDSGTVRR